ncbi:MAG: response regulator [Bacteroidota bacterium]|jgi:CheY-like chemotaxis protein
MRRYLLVDDDTIFNFLHTEVIKTVDDSAQIDLFNSSMEGLEFLKDALEDKHPMPNFLFLDIRMPEMDGFEYLDELMKFPIEKFKDLRIYVLSSSLAERDKEKSLSYPIVTGFIEKTLTIEKLKGIIETYPM